MRIVGIVLREVFQFWAPTGSICRTKFRLVPRVELVTPIAYDLMGQCKEVNIPCTAFFAELRERWTEDRIVLRCTLSSRICRRSSHVSDYERYGRSMVPRTIWAGVVSTGAHASHGSCTPARNPCHASQNRTGVHQPTTASLLPLHRESHNGAPLVAQSPQQRFRGLQL